MQQRRCQSPAYDEQHEQSVCRAGHVKSSVYGHKKEQEQVHGGGVHRHKEEERCVLRIHDERSNGVPERGRPMRYFLKILLLAFTMTMTSSPGPPYGKHSARPCSQHVVSRFNQQCDSQQVMSHDMICGKQHYVMSRLSQLLSVPLTSDDRQEHDPSC